MIPYRSVLTLLLLSLSASRTPAQKYLDTPIGIVRFYCNFDLNTGRISSENFAKLPPIMAWDEEPGWDGVEIVSGFKILTSKQSKEEAVVTVSWAVLGLSVGEDVTVDEKNEIVEYQLRLVNGHWKIEKPVLSPHVSLFTLRAFVQKQFQVDPNRGELWLRHLDDMERKLGTSAYSMPPGVLEALGRDEKDYCDQLGVFGKDCVQTFRAHLSWRQMTLTPQGQKAILVENAESCGSAGCALSLFVERKNGKFVQVLGPNGEVGSLNRVKVLKTVINGHFNIQKTWDDGKTQTIYEWNGEWYSSSSKP